jgi:uncharacterized membrane protein YeaQ/YmgE (transglycosylase-associated protein family)
MGILSWIVLGLVAGILARWAMPGQGPSGLILTSLLGIGGGMLGGYLGTHLGIGSVTGFNLTSLVLAVGGAVLLLLVYGVLKKKNIL